MVFPVNSREIGVNREARILRFVAQYVNEVDGRITRILYVIFL